MIVTMYIKLYWIRNEKVGSVIMFGMVVKSCFEIGIHGRPWENGRHLQTLPLIIIEQQENGIAKWRGTCERKDTFLHPSFFSFLVDMDKRNGFLEHETPLVLR